MHNNIYTRIVSGIAAAVMTLTNITPLTPMRAEEDYYPEQKKASATDTIAPSTAPVTETFCGPTESTEPTEEVFCGPTECTEETTEPFCGPIQENPFPTEETTVWAEEDLSHQSIELYPNGEETEQIVSLEGLMPEGATAEVVDVSAENNGIAAYDITISDGETEYQPGEEHPILVEITDPVIADVENIELWHIMDDGTREQIFDFTLEDGTVSFYATGFSVYEIVEPMQDLNVAYDVVPVSGESSYGKYTVNPVSGENSFVYTVDRKFYPGIANRLTSLGEFMAHAGDGVYISTNRNKFYLKNEQSNNVRNPGRSGITIYNDINATTDDLRMQSAYANGAKKYYFEPDENSLFKIYTFADDGTTKKYVGHNNTSKEYCKRIYLTNDDANNNPQFTDETLWHPNYTGEY